MDEHHEILYKGKITCREVPILIIFSSFVDYLPGWAYGRNGSIFETTSVECPEGEEKE